MEELKEVKGYIPLTEEQIQDATEFVESVLTRDKETYLICRKQQEFLKMMLNFGRVYGMGRDSKKLYPKLKVLIAEMKGERW